MSIESKHIEPKFYQLWGYAVKNDNFNSAHLAHGLLRILDALDLDHLDGLEVCEITQASPQGDEIYEELKKHLKDLDGLSGELGKARRAFGVSSTKWGEVIITDPQPVASNLPTNALRDIEVSGRNKLNSLQSDSTSKLSRQGRELIAEVLSCDKTLSISGGEIATTTSPEVMGFDSNYTIRNFLPLTALALLGVDLLKRLKSHLISVSGEPSPYDPHRDMLELLGLIGEPLASQAGVARPHRLPIPTALAADTSLREVVERLMSWYEDNDGRLTCTRGQLLTELTDLISLYFPAQALSRSYPSGEGAGGGEARPLLLISRKINAEYRELQKVASSVMIISRVSLTEDLRERVEHQIRSDDDPAIKEEFEELTDEGRGFDFKRCPFKAAFRLAARAGWMWPANLNGGARVALSPGGSQLRTLIRSLVDPGERVDWDTLNERALKLGVHFGGKSYRGQVESKQKLSRIKRFNEDYLIEMNLAERLADDVLYVHGGSR